MRFADELIRVTLDASGTLVVGRSQPGRGAWLCRGSPDCVEAAIRRRAFERALRRPVPANAARELRDRLEGTVGGAPASAEVGR